MGTLNCTQVNATQVAVGTGGITFNNGSTLSAAPSNTLNDLTDVSVSSPSTNDLLSWNGSAWVNATVSTGIDSGNRA